MPGIGAMRGVPDVAGDASPSTDMAFVSAAPGGARSPLYDKAFHDVTTGNNTVVLNADTICGNQAGPGRDPSPAGGPPTRKCSCPSFAHNADQ